MGTEVWGEAVGGRVTQILNELEPGERGEGQRGGRNRDRRGGRGRGGGEISPQCLLGVSTAPSPLECWMYSYIYLFFNSCSSIRVDILYYFILVSGIQHSS